MALAVLAAASSTSAQTSNAGDFRQDYGPWQLFCVAQPPANTPPCEIRQLLKNPQGQFVIGLFYTEVGNRGLFMLRGAPALDALLQAGVVMEADIGFGTDAFRYVGCDPLGCLTQLPMKRVVVGILERAAWVSMEVGSDSTDRRKVTFQLDGFSAALAAMRAR